MDRRANLKLREYQTPCLPKSAAGFALRERLGFVTRLGLALPLAFALSAPAWADTFKCMDANGHATYTNMKEETKGKNCTVVMREISVVPANPSPRAATANSSPAGFPRVDAATQKSRDDARRKILEDELSGEQKALATAKQELTKQESVRNGDERNYQKVLDRLQPYKDEVDRHEKNVVALQKELNSVR